ncbi:MAG: hypothetical protein DMG65_07440 [Candidatus Angelobacter sp. Gp1-AA117]|nr:MAG: hypothetical protein DMG65_07440 [Candidatus Angelobacter sp. Gp1-AA117]
MNAFTIHCVYRLLGIALLLFSTQLASAEDPANFIRQSVHRVWTTEDGLPQNSVNAIIQTKDGYLWMGTQEGLVRFNGATFTIFDKRSTKAMRGNTIHTLMEDREGNLWIATSRGGLMQYRAGEFRTYSRNEGLADDSVNALLQDAKGKLWIGTPNGLDRFEKGTFIHYRIAQGLSGNSVKALAETSDGDLWVATNNGLDRIQHGDFQSENIDHLLPGTKINVLHADGETLWIGTQSSGVYRLSAGKLVHYNSKQGLRDAPVISMMQDQDGLWVGTYRGGFCHLSGGEKEKFDCFSSKDGLNNEVVLSMLRDREGSFWAGTLTGGLNQFRRARFTTLDPDRADASPARSLYEARDGSIWVGTDSGLNRYKDGRVQSYLRRNSGVKNDVRSVMQSRDSSIWVGTKNGLNQFSNGMIRRYTVSDGLPDNRIYAVYQDHSGAIWIGTEHGISRFVDGQFQKFNVQSGAPTNLVWSIFEDHEYNLWFGTYGGLALFRDGRFIPEKEDKRLALRDVTYFYEDADHVLWMTTAGSGLKRVDHGRITSYSQDEGLFNETIWAVLEDDEKDFWISSNRGIFKVAKPELNAFATGQISQINSISYDAEDGASAECNGGSQNPALKTSKGELLFACLHGVVVAPRRFSQNDFAPPVVIEKALLNGEPVSQNAEISISKEKLDFYFAALSYVVPSQNTFKYRLEPDDNEWTFASRGEAHYANLAPGRYQFRVVAANSDGNWNRIGASFSFYLKPPFYHTKWFYSLCVLGIILFGIGYYRWHAWQMRKREEELIQQVDERTSQLQQQIAKRKEIEEVLARAAAIVDSSSDAIWSTDLRGTTITWNSGAERLFGYSAQEMIGHPIFPIIPSDRNQEVAHYVECLRRGESLTSMETVRQAKSGELLDVSLSLAPILKDKRVIGISVIARDIGDRKRAEKALKQAKEAAEAATKAKSEFLANMSHEIRTPLNGVIGMLELASHAEVAPEQSELLNTAQDSANTLLVIINDILDFSKIEAGKMELNLVEFDLSDAVTEAVRTLALRAHEKHLELQCHIAPDVPRSLLGDSARLKQVLVNLAGNAIKFTARGQVTLRVDPERLNGEELELKFSIADTGVGIPAEKQDVIFDPFSQGDASITRKYGGTGLGLAICFRLVSLMGGRIWLESEVGRGSTFYFTAIFRLAESNLNRSQRPQAMNGLERQDSARKLNVLLAEDNIVNQKLVVRFLARAGHRAVVAGNGREALDKLAEENFDVVLMDVQMPEMDGIAATEAIRAGEKTTKAHIPIIAMTAHAMKGDRERCLAAGMDEYLAKPLTQRDLLETIHRVLQNVVYQPS